MCMAIRRPRWALSTDMGVRGRAGGLVGGLARAKALSKSERVRIAKAGGIARAKALSKSERMRISKAASRARWPG